MLTSLLPGLRDLRTPLSVGYLWLLAAWLLFGESLPTTKDATGLMARIYALGDTLGTSVALAALSFGAYLIGSVTTHEALSPGRTWMRILRPLKFRWQLRRKATITYVSNLEPAAERALSDFIRSELSRVARETNGIWWDEVADAFEMDDGQRWEIPNDSVPQAMLVETVEEKQVLAVRLQIASDNIFQSYDRKRAEAEFRSAITLPLLAIVCVLAYKQASGVWLLLAVVPLALAWQGLVRSRQADTELVQVLTQGVIKAPIIERLAEAARRRHAAYASADQDPSLGLSDGEYVVPEQRVMIYASGQVNEQPTMELPSRGAD